MNSPAPLEEESSGLKLRLGIAAMVVAVLAAVTIVVTSGEDATQTTAPTPPQTTTVSRGDLVTTDTLDGTVELANQLVVVHRIDGAEPSTGSIEPTSNNSSTGSIQPIAYVQTTSTTTTSTTTSTTTTSTTTTTEPPVSTTTAAPATTTTVDPCSEVPPTTTTEPGSTSTTTTTTTLPDGTPTTTTVPEPDPCANPDQPTPPDPQVSSTTTQPSGTRGGGTGGTPSGQATTPDAAARVQGSQSAPSSQGATGAEGGATAATRVTEVVTSVSPIDTAVDNGTILYSANGKPVITMLGETPAWRTLSTDSDNGVDILQLETALAAMGYVNDGSLVVDSTFDSYTEQAIEDWQSGLGIDPTGIVELGDVVFIPEPTTVIGVDVAVGDEISDGDGVVVLDSAQVQISATVPEELRTRVTEGLTVEVAGAEAVIDRLVSATGADGVEVQAMVIPLAVLEAEAGDDVTVRVTTTVAADALIVPAEAISSLVDGSYGVRELNGVEPGPWIAVTPVAESEGDVAVDSESLTDGANIIVP